MTAFRRQRLARGALAVAFAIAAVATFAPPADAEAPARVGWWNMVSAGGVSAPAPATPSGGMHIAAGPGQVLAYGAVLYPLPAHALLGQLTLKIAGSQGAVALLACPTKSTGWTSGDDQAADRAPAYDCSTTHISGAVAASGQAVTFALSSLPAGSLSLAIVPDVTGDGASPVGVNQPFSVDLDKPDSSSLHVTTSPAPQAGAPPPASTTHGATPPVPTNTSTATAAGRPLGVPNLPPPSTTTQTTTSGAAAPPEVAPSTPPPASAAAQPAAAGGRSAGARAGSIFGALALVAAFMFWGMGRGLLGGKILPLSTPTRSAQP